MARPSQAIAKLRQKIETDRFDRQLLKSKRKAQRRSVAKEAKRKVRKKVAPARIEAKATKNELGKLSEEVAHVTSGPRSQFGKAASLFAQGGKAAGQKTASLAEKLPEPQMDADPIDITQSPEKSDPFQIDFGGGGDGDVSGLGGSQQQSTPSPAIEFGMDSSPGDFDLFSDTDGGSDPQRYL